MNMSNIRGRVWLFGDNVDTDQMAPLGTVMADWETIRASMFPARPDFARGAVPGDIVVAGRNWGCGSSRELAPANLKRLGIGAVVAESFGRIFYRNAVAIALPCLACPGISEAAGEKDEIEIDLATGTVRNLTHGTLLQGHAPTSDMLEIIRVGGILNTLVSSPPKRPEPDRQVWRPRTMAEKVLLRASGEEDVAPGQYVTAKVDRVVLGEFIYYCAEQLRQAGITRLFDPDRVSETITMAVPAPTIEVASLHSRMRAIAAEFGIGRFYSRDGIINQVIMEKGDALPGQLIFGSDSHSTTYGAIGAAGAGLGMTELTYVLARGVIWMRVPETIRFELVGEAGPGVTSKDIALHLLKRFGSDYAQYRAIEYGGPFADRMSLASRTTLCNMGVEMGAKFAMFAADETTLAFLRPRASGEISGFGPDPGADYWAVHTIDVSEIGPQVAKPHNPSNAGPIEESAGTPIDQAFLGSCANGRLEDFAVAATLLRGHRVASSTRLVVTPASGEVLLEAARAGYVETLLEAGALITPAGCGACVGACGGVLGPGETCISTTNRNFRGRMGSPEAEVYLASPATVAASAITGRITDPRELWPDGAMAQALRFS
jgi:3-isopropylmalate/(R)-2-methylmalate dehydratase large subunit